MRRIFTLLIALALPPVSALAQDADWEACKSYDAGKSADACSRIITAAKEPPPALAVAHNNRAVALESLHRRTEALADYAAAIRLDPASAKAYFNRALLLAQLDRKEAARLDLDAAIHLDPRYAKAYARRGIDRLDSEPAQGIDDLGRALELTPKLALETKAKSNPYEDQSSKGSSLAKRIAIAGGKLAAEPGGIVKAQKAYELALRIEPANADARKGLASIRQQTRPVPPVPAVTQPTPPPAPPKVQPPAKAPAPAAKAPLQTAPQPAPQTAPKSATPLVAPVPTPPTRPAPSGQPPAVSAATGDMIQFAGRAAEGNDIERLAFPTLAECQTRCKATAGCGAFSYDGWNKLCFLKTTATCLRRDPRYITAVAAGINVRQSTEPTVIDRRRQRAYPDTGYRTSEAATIDACSDLCQQDDRCEGFNYKAATKACSLMARPGEYSQDATTEVGIRTQRASPSCRG